MAPPPYGNDVPVMHAAGLRPTLGAAAGAWLDDRAPTLAGALAFSTIFALAPLFVIIMVVTGRFVPGGVVEAHLINQISHAVGSDAAAALRAMVDAAHANTHTGDIVGAIGWLVLLGAAAGIFLTLQDALNIIWHVDVPKHQPLGEVLRARAGALAMVFAMAVFLIVTLALDALIAAAATRFGTAAGGFALVLGPIVSIVLSIAGATVVFATAYRALPQRKIAWRGVWRGALVAGVLFVAGQWGIAIFLAHAGLQKGYGPAGSVLGLLMWIYVSSMILFFGAEIAKIDTEARTPSAAR